MREGAKSTLPHKFYILVAAATDENERDDKDPYPVVVKKSAKAVGIHKISSL